MKNEFRLIEAQQNARLAKIAANPLMASGLISRRKLPVYLLVLCAIAVCILASYALYGFDRGVERYEATDNTPKLIYACDDPRTEKNCTLKVGD